MHKVVCENLAVTIKKEREQQRIIGGQQTTKNLIPDAGFKKGGGHL